MEAGLEVTEELEKPLFPIPGNKELMSGISALLTPKSEVEAEKIRKSVCDTYTCRKGKMKVARYLLEQGDRGRNNRGRRSDTRRTSDHFRAPQPQDPDIRIRHTLCKARATLGNSWKGM